MRVPIIIGVVLLLALAFGLASPTASRVPYQYAPLPSSALRGYVVDPSRQPSGLSDEGPDPTYPRSADVTLDTCSGGAACNWGAPPPPPVVLVPQPRPTPHRLASGDRTSPASGVSMAATLRGVATWYRYIPGQAAAGYALRKALGPSWRGTRVRVCAASRCIVVTLTDSMGRTTRLIDLDPSDFARLAPLGQGVVQVVVR